MKQLLYISLLLIFLTISCKDKKKNPVAIKRIKQTETKVKVMPELHTKLVEENSSIDTAQYRLLVGAGFAEEVAKFDTYAGSSVEFADTSLHTEQFKFAYANINKDTLIIHLSPSSSLSSLLSGHGVAVTVVDGRFSSHYFEWSDISPDAFKVEAAYNKLTLNTNDFEKGDTIAGKIFYRSNEVSDGLGGKKKIYASGYFRAIID